MDKIITIGKFPPQKAVKKDLSIGLISWIPLGEFSVDGITYLAASAYLRRRGEIVRYQTNYGAMFSFKEDMGILGGWRDPFFADDRGFYAMKKNPEWADLEWTPDISP